MLLQLTLIIKLKTAKKVLERDMRTMKRYYRKWCLCMNDSKSEVTIFHLNNQMAARKLKIILDGEEIPFNNTPTYLGLPLDRSLTYNPALTKLSEKLKPRINLIQKLAGTDWGANGDILRTAVLSLVYSVAEYCAPVWYRSSHLNKVNSAEYCHENNHRLRRFNSNSMAPRTFKYSSSTPKTASGSLQRVEKVHRLIPKLQTTYR